MKSDDITIQQLFQDRRQFMVNSPPLAAKKEKSEDPKYERLLPQRCKMNKHMIFPKEQIAEFCRRWKVKELAIFGSALGDDFKPESDIDVLVVFDDSAEWSLFDYMHAEEELKQLFGRKVDLVEKKAIRNPFRRHHILNHCEVIYAA